MSLQSRPLFGYAANVPFGQGAAAETVVQAAEAAGFDLFSITDHPYGAQSFEPYAAVPYLLGRTSRISGYVGVTNLPLRPAPMLARTVASIASLSGGRFALGLGSGGYWEHITRMGVPHLTPRQAVDAFDEAIDVVRGLTGGPGRAVDFEGEHYRADHLAPSAVPTPPIWTGSGGPRALAITGRKADGWIPPGGADWTTQVYREGRARIAAAAGEAGRDPAEIITVVNLGTPILSAADLTQTRGPDGRFVGGSARQWVDELTGAVSEHGIAGFNAAVLDENGSINLDTIARFGAEVIAPVRGTLGR
jgi:alkanesulfonate monooxygenase SsuD/methylene tetrahydromethanopterin reductase-like flavin-dependent oxidoreductase (luciferase family)